MLLLRTYIVLPIFLRNAIAHSGGHEQIPLAKDADWATRHMAEEHHIQSFDPETFFTLHDFHSRGEWSGEDIQRLYGLFDASNSQVPSSAKATAVQKIIDRFDQDGSGTISSAEYVNAISRGIKLPDLGFGPGHHGDDEYEYEIHHWEKYHSGDDFKEEDLTHPEDIAHFKKHDEEEAMQEAWEKLEKEGGIIVKNIPKKFLREP
ncbi:hypothetical protein EJ08DRAFT_326943 [Tothia fuscella]|uniref:EF-hand domain-containing protein n=1 Tax=Tothia fuscella TaxID=1048955 RepID=A0A9P4NML4_9PEZI|nr:hypothetical protein EJ08DRAFT_326943 [Tothia fuscella]